MGGRFCRALRHHNGGNIGCSFDAAAASVALPGNPQGAATKSRSPETQGHATKRSRLDPENSTTSGPFWLVLLPEEQVRSILSYLDLATFALAAKPSCQLVSGLVGCDSFEGWFHEIRHLLELCPWVKKQSFDQVIEANPGLQMHQYRSVLKRLDRDFVTSGLRILPEAARSPGVVAVPDFFGSPQDTLVFACKACGSFLS